LAMAKKWKQVQETSTEEEQEVGWIYASQFHTKCEILSFSKKWLKILLAEVKGKRRENESKTGQ
jgi:hypothetical protein